MEPGREASQNVGLMELEVERLRRELAVVEAELGQVTKRPESLRCINWKWIHEATKFSGLYERRP